MMNNVEFAILFGLLALGSIQDIIAMVLVGRLMRRIEALEILAYDKLPTDEQYDVINGDIQS